MNRVALITGGTRGIGKAICFALRDAGYSIITTCRKDDDLSCDTHTGITTYYWDISDFDECEKNIKEIEKKHGPIDILVNNAGIIQDSFLHKMEQKAWQDVINVNLSGCFNMCHALINQMRERKFGRIVSISSINGLMGCMGQTNYSASKAGIIGFSKSLALESILKNITVNVIAPGYIRTEMTAQIPEDIQKKIIDSIPCKRFGTPEEIARAVLFLVDDNAGFITGETLSINGGAYMQ